MYRYNHPHLKARRRDLRNNQTDAERILWYQLRKRKIEGIRFVRQYSVGPFILDFFAPELRLAIELDGSHHGSDFYRSYDESRRYYLNRQKILVIRFWNNQVFTHMDDVIETIRFKIGEIRTR